MWQSAAERQTLPSDQLPMPSPAAQPYFLAHPAPPLALQIRPVQVLHPQSALLSPVPYQTPFAPRAAPHAMKTLHHPAVIEVLASRVDDFHLPHIQQHYTPNPPHDSEDDIIRGNPDDPLTQLAAAAAVEHKQMLARERNLKVAQAEHELELRKKKDAMKLEKERLDWEKEKRELRESAALLQEKWRELHEMQQGLRPVTAPPPSLALLAGVGPMKTKRATTVKALVG